VTDCLFFYFLTSSRGKEEVVVLVPVLPPFKFTTEHAGNLKQFVHIIIPPIFFHSTLFSVFGLRVVMAITVIVVKLEGIEVYIYVNVRCLSRHSRSVCVVARSGFQGGRLCR